jgi:uncharacterized protein YecE (DUF72 family)
MTTRLVIVGTCGFPASRAKIYSMLDGAELQESFYNLLGKKTLENLANRPKNFHLTFKAWQATTHPYSSPTWKKMKEPPPGDKTKYGWLRCTKENLWALEKTVEQAKDAGAEVIVFQTPPNMPCSSEHLAEVRCFFEHAISTVGGNIAIAWEPRGEWLKAKDALKKVFDMGVLIVSDYLRTPPMFPESLIAYTRLHGLGESEVNYKYKYTDEDLRRLKDIIKNLESEKVYVMFNNVYMLDDATRFRNMLID